MARVFIGLGSNMGDRYRHISRAVAAVGRLHATRLVQMAPIVETDAVSVIPQERFLNSVLEVETKLEPFALFDLLKQVEQDLGRVASAQLWGPRPIDLDVLFYDDAILVEEKLLIPHPRLHERWFVLHPLAQLDKSFEHPVLHKSVAELLAALPQPPAQSADNLSPAEEPALAADSAL